MWTHVWGVWRMIQYLQVPVLQQVLGDLHHMTLGIVVQEDKPEIH